MNPTPDETSVDRMAIPEGGVEDHMDDDDKKDDIHGDGRYVSILSKGPGRPICIRQENKLQTVGQPVEANNARLTPAEPGVFKSGSAKIPYMLAGTYINHNEDFLDKNTGYAVPLEDNDIGSPQSFKIIRKGEDNGELEGTKKGMPETCKKIVENETDNEMSEMDFQTQAHTYSLSVPDCSQTKMPKNQIKVRNKCKSKAVKKGFTLKKKAASPKKSNRGVFLSSQAGLKLKNTPLVLDDSNVVTIHGKKHRRVIIYLPVEEEDSEMTESAPLNKEGPTVDPNSLEENIHRVGSIDRHSENNVTDVQASTSMEEHYVHAEHTCHQILPGTVNPHIFDVSYDQPLDLTMVPPLDLSMKTNSANIADGGEQLGLTKEVDEFQEIQDTWTEAHAESNTTEYRTRCASALSMDDRECVAGEELQEPGPIEGCSADNCDGNLPSLGKLSLEPAKIVKETVEGSIKGVQESIFEERIASVACSSVRQNTLSIQKEQMTNVQSNKTNLVNVQQNQFMTNVQQNDQVGTTVQQKKQQKFSLQQVLEAGFTIPQVLQAGFTIPQVLQAGFTIPQVLQAGITIQQVLQAGITIPQVLQAGITVPQVLQAGVGINQIFKVWVSIQQQIQQASNHQTTQHGTRKPSSQQDLPSMLLHNPSLPRMQQCGANWLPPNEEAVDKKPLIPELDHAQEIPAPAMPNFQSLELANSHGGILESSIENVKFKLKKKILDKDFKL